VLLSVDETKLAAFAHGGALPFNTVREAGAVASAEPARHAKAATTGKTIRTAVLVLIQILPWIDLYS
jgi:hypothetical protein